MFEAVKSMALTLTTHFHSMRKRVPKPLIWIRVKEIKGKIYAKINNKMVDSIVWRCMLHSYFMKRFDIEPYRININNKKN